jgi:aspartyl-tRNA(Asn)/glutamyl-tRNA(Gln) amidotransferase subunit B
MNTVNKYEAVIGLEIHAQLLTQTKLFSADAISFGEAPNTQISEIVLAHPGTLPKTNKKAVELAIKMGLACNCQIEEVNYFARKNYFYADLPKGYQTSQHTTPICKGGYVEIETAAGIKKVQLNRIHLEEDAGKSIHDADDIYSLIDLNRAGTPLIEIVTEPCLHSAEEAYLYVSEIRKLVQWLGVCDGNMEEGSLRCDANISVRPLGSATLGTKVEVKNLNSIRNVKKAIEYEVERLIGLLENNEPIVQQTRSFDANTDTTFAIRDKEDANDYRYFSCPDLPPFIVTKDWLQKIQAQMPALPNTLKKLLVENYLLSPYDANLLCSDNALVNYFLATAQLTNNYKAIVNWLAGPIKEYLNENNSTINTLSLQPNNLADIISLVETGKVNFSVAATKILPRIIDNINKSAQAIAEELNLLQTNNEGELEAWVNTVLSNMPDKVQEYKKGKKGLIGLFVGEVKKISKGKANPQAVTILLEKKLQS